jgi:hypothetical protein
VVCQVLAFEGRTMNGVEFTSVQMDLGHLAGRGGDKNQPNRELIRSADLILGVDPVTGEEAIFYGRKLLKDIASGRGAEFGRKLAVRVVMDLSEATDEVEWLHAAIDVLKGPGACEFRYTDEQK